MQNKSEKIMQYVFMFSALISIIAVILICAFLFATGIPAIIEIGVIPFFSGTTWRPQNNLFGILPMIVASLAVTFGSILVGVPVGVLSAVYMAKFCPNWLYKILKPLVNLLAGIPSVIFGFFGLIVLVPLIKQVFGGSGSSMFTAIIVLAMMILPTIIGVSESVIRALPKSYYESARALGASQERSIFFVLLPAAKRGVFAAVVLGIGRVIGETMAVIMVAGNQARMPKGLFQGVRTMTGNIVLEMGYAADLHRGALIATGVVLLFFILIITVIFAYLQKEER